MYLLDTNVCIDFLLGRSSVLSDHVLQATGALNLSAITVAELRVGSRTSTDPKGDQHRIDSFVAALNVLAFGAEEALAYADIVRASGMRRNNCDRLIGAHALAAGLILVTRNETDFADIKGLRIENWTLA